MNLKKILFLGLLWSCALPLCAQTPVSQQKVFIDEHDTPVWDRLRSDFRLDYSSSEYHIKNQRAAYMRHPAHLKTTLDRSAPFLYFITEELERRQLPGELALIPIVESSYNPRARSASNAAGLWQMIPGTAKNFGIKQNGAYDGRYDIYASTHAALDYLVALNKKFDGDWLLTIAAYHAGEGNVDRAIKRNRALGKPTDYWSLSNAKSETRPYVQRILALADIIDNAESYGLTLPPISNHPSLILVTVNQQIDLNRVAQITGMSLSELQAINPGYLNRATSTPKQGPHHLLLPVESVKPFTESIGSL